MVNEENTAVLMDYISTNVSEVLIEAVESAAELGFSEEDISAALYATINAIRDGITAETDPIIIEEVERLLNEE